MPSNIGVLYGGMSAEREVSLNSGEAVYRALLEKGYQAVKIDVGRDLVDNLTANKVELAFIALHGRLGEDGTIQGLLEMLGIPYTGSGVLASALAMDKVISKKLFIYEGIPTPPFVKVEKKQVMDTGYGEAAQGILAKLELPLVVKPALEGSTIGISFVYTEDELVPGLEKAFTYGSTVLVEKFITGVEVTASIIGNESPVALPLIEIVSATGHYDYQAKYTKGMSEHIIPPRIDPQWQEKMRDLSLMAYKAVGCRGFARVDGIIDSAGNVYILEVNTIPGMTETSLIPDAARAAGISFPELVDKLVRFAWENKAG